MEYRFMEPWHLQFAYTYVDARYSDAYRTCISAPCAVSNVLVAAGNRLPGVPRNDVFASLRWGEDVGLHLAASAQYLSSVAVNDLNTVFAPGYAVFGLDAGYGMQMRLRAWSAFLRINNLFNRRYVGSVIIDDATGGYFEPAPGFNLLLGGSFTFR